MNHIALEEEAAEQSAVLYRNLSTKHFPEII